MKLPAYSISNKDGFIPQNTQFGEGNTYSKTNKETNYIVNPHSFAYNPARINVGSIGYQSLETPVLISSLYEVFVTGKEIDDGFLWEWFSTKLFSDQVKKYQEGGVRQYYFFDKLQASQIKFPHIEEQKKIYQIFKKIDALIDLYQRKLDLLNQLKQGMLQKLFTDKKQKQPDYRFIGFHDDWKSIKTGKLLLERNEKKPESPEYPLMAFIAHQGVAPKGERYNREALVKNTKTKLYKRTKKGDFIYSSNNLETGSIGLNNYGNASISPVYSIFQPTNMATSDFIGRRFIRKDYINDMIRWRQGVVYGQWKIHESDFLKIQVAVPSINEQNKIGVLLSILDRKIELCQKYLKLISRFKKFLLQQMFI